MTIKNHPEYDNLLDVSDTPEFDDDMKQMYEEDTNVVLTAEDTLYPPDPIFEVQTRSEKNGFHYFPTLKDAMAHAQSDTSVFKISFSIPNGERVRLVYEDWVGGWVYESPEDANAAKMD